MPGDLQLALRIRADLGQATRRLDQLQRELRQTGTAAGGAGRQAAVTARGVDRVAEASRRSARDLRQSAASMERFETSAGRASGRLSTLLLAFGFGGAVLAVRRFGESVTDTGLQIEALEQRFTFATGTIADGANEMAFARQEAERLGISFSSAAQGYSSLLAAAKGTNLSAADTREIFLGIAEAATVLRLDTGQLLGALTAIEQIISKGKVTAEELRGQLGERLPGAVQIMSRALGIGTGTLDKMLEQGELTADALVPFARQLRKEFGESVPDAADSAAASFARLGNSIERLEESIAKSGLLDFLAAAADLTTDVIEGVQRFSRSFGAQSAGLAQAQEIVEQVEALARTDPAKAVEGVDALRSALGAVTGRLAELRGQLEEIREGKIVDRGTLIRITSSIATAERIENELERLISRAEAAIAGQDRPLPVTVEKAPETDRGREREEARANARLERLRQQHEDRMARIGLDAVGRAVRARVEALRQIEQLEAGGGDPAVAARARIAVERRFAREISTIRRRLHREQIDAEIELLRTRREARQEGLRDLAAIERGLLSPYNRAVAEADEWLRRTVANFEAAGVAAAEYGDIVAREFNQRLDTAVREETERRLRESRRWQDGAARAFRDYTDQATNAADAAERAINSGLRSMEDAFVDFARTGKLEFSDLVNSIVADLARIQARRALSGLFGGLGGGGGGGLFGGLLGGLFGGGGGLPLGFHGGGRGAGEASFRRTGVPPWVFLGAPRFHEGRLPGVRDGEIPAIIREEESVLTPEQMRALGGRASGPREVRVEIRNEGTPQRATEAEATFDAGEWVISLVTQDIAAGGDTARAIESIVPGTTL